MKCQVVDAVDYIISRTNKDGVVDIDDEFRMECAITYIEQEDAIEYAKKQIKKHLKKVVQ